MLFTTDKQTLEDLNIFGKHGRDSIYNIFNRCATRGGAAILEELFRYPLSDQESINRRSSVIQFFARTGLAFPVQAVLFDAIEPYLANTDERTRASASEQNIGKKISNLISVDADTAQIQKGVAGLVELLQSLYEFMGNTKQNNAGAFQQEADKINLLLADPAFEPVFTTGKKQKLSQELISSFDTLFRFRYRETIQKLLRHVFHLDVYITVAKVAQENGFVFPVALAPGKHMQIEELRHPQLKNAVSNNISIDSTGNVIFLTGANMAGKSTFMKSISIALFLAHMGFPVAASKMEFSVMDGIYTTINLPDNLGMGASHFYAEVLRVKKMANELSQNKNLFIVFDELFRGTNVKDAYEATIAITDAFASKKNSIFLISTHIIEAGDVLRKQCSNVRFIYLPTKMNGNQPVYTYKLEEGITDDRHGMVIINNEGILDILEQGLHQSIS